ncbi:MAG: hypothetical protein GY702_09195 [Desulfobulbaceae bacterium]|nr:hypothetical protein [Desulfobulbaceae bacterium]
MKKTNKSSKILLTTIAVIILTVSQVWATTVDVYAEGGYTDTKFTINIYADIRPTAHGALLSAGVKLTYPDSKLQNPVAIKNEKEWYFGTPENMYAYIDPYVGSAGEAVFLLGKFDQNNPQEGVEGDRTHLGRIMFDRIVGTDIPSQADFSLLGGKVAPFVDFATVTGVELDDSVNFSISPVVPSSILNMRGVIKILSVVSGMSPDEPVRATEMDTDNDGVVGIGEAIILLKEAAQ